MIPLRPSSAHVWTKCPGQPTMVSRLPPEVPSDPAREGTCAAWVAEMVLTGQVPDAAAMLGRSHENGWLITDDMVAYIAKYVEQVRSHGGKVSVERKVRLNRWVEGTPDAFAVLDADGVLRADDLKYGFGIVEPYRNPQVSIYVAAILRHLTSRDVIIRRVVIGIYQPRAWHPAGVYRTWACTPEQLMEFVHEIEATIPDTQVENPKLTAGSHCDHCPAAATCAAVAHENYRVFEHVASDTQRHMSGDELARELSFLQLAQDMLDARTTAVYAEAEARMKQAQHIPGWHMEERRGQRRWKVPAPVVKALTGIDPEVKKMVTPAELERLGASPVVVKAITELPLIKPKLTRIPPGYYKGLFK
jgi:hypothetical protein